MGIKRHTELDVYKRSFEAAMVVFRMTKTFPREERYSLVDQIRRSSRSVSANLAEAWRKRRYEAAFVAKLSDCEAEGPCKKYCVSGGNRLLPISPISWRLTHGCDVDEEG